MIKITPDEFKVITKYVYGISGITLEASKTYLVETRLSGLTEELGCASYSELYFKAKADATKTIEKKVINAITTQETLFFRDTGPFEVLKHKILPDLIDIKSKQSNTGRIPIRIWSAACSTGQEAYSTAITIRELLGSDISKYTIKILGTDISDAAVAAASYGKYNKFEIERGLSADKLNKYFELDGDVWKIKDEIRIMATFKKFNLFDNFATLGKFDIVLCRNVAIYFSAEDKAKIFNKIADILEPNGKLIIGSSEYLANVCPRFESQRHIKSVFYQLKTGDAKPLTPAQTVAAKLITKPALAIA